MNKNSKIAVLAILLLILTVGGYYLYQSKKVEKIIDTNGNNDYLVSFFDSVKDECGYINQKGEVIIPLGKYERCSTDTFRTYAIVVVSGERRIVAIDRQENVLYEVFLFDNGPDYVSDGLFRIIENNKIGFADSLTGEVVIQPQFVCALPFENGVAQISSDCTQTGGEHSTWVSDNWSYIDKTGKNLAK